MHDSTQLSSVRWISSTLHPDRRIAQPTLIALERMLQRDAATGATLVGAAPNRLDEVPSLGAVGGIARVEASGGFSVGVARVGRNSFVGYRLTDLGLAEVEVAVDEASGALQIGLPQAQ